jgi:hypothetical protein
MSTTLYCQSKDDDIDDEAPTLTGDWKQFRDNLRTLTTTPNEATEEVRI